MRTRHTERCRELLERISRLVDGEISASERRTIVAHLRRCPCCEKMTKGLEHTVEICRQVKNTRLPASVRSRARARVAELLASNPKL